MTTNKPGTVAQRPLFGCANCYEDFSYPADHLHVYNGECWCEICWEEATHEIADGLDWRELEPFKPALQAECEQLRSLLRHAQPIIRAHAEASHMLDGFRPKRNQWDELVETIDAAIDAAIEI